MQFSQEQIATVGYFALVFGHLESAVRGIVFEVAGTPRDVAQGLMGQRSGNGFTFGEAWYRLHAVLRCRLPKRSQEQLGELDKQMRELRDFRNDLLHTGWMSFVGLGIGDPEEHVLRSGSKAFAPELILEMTGKCEHAQYLLLGVAGPLGLAASRARDADQANRIEARKLYIDLYAKQEFVPVRDGRFKWTAELDGNTHTSSGIHEREARRMATSYLSDLADSAIDDLVKELGSSSKVARTLARRLQARRRRESNNRSGRSGCESPARSG